MTERYFVESPISEDRAVLSGSEAYHLTHVMRLGPGDSLTLFDGSGHDFAGRVEQLGRGEVTVKIQSRQVVSRELALRLTIGVALPKGDRQRWLVEKLTELGVACLAPLVLSRSVAQPGDKALGRLRRAVIEASKQCGRNRLMEIAAPAAWSGFLATTADASSRLLAHAGGQTPASLLVQTESDGHVCVAIGPEGGFTNEEIDTGVAAGWRTVDLGARTLRTETAAVLLAGLLSARG